MLDLTIKMRNKNDDIIVGSQEAKEWIKNNFDIDTRIQ